MQERTGELIPFTSITVMQEAKGVVVLRQSHLSPRSPAHQSPTRLSLLGLSRTWPRFFRQQCEFSRSPGVAFPLPQHSWDAIETTQDPHSAVQCTGPRCVPTATWAGRVRPADSPSAKHIPFLVWIASQIAAELFLWMMMCI